VTSSHPQIPHTRAHSLWRSCIKIIVRAILRPLVAVLLCAGAASASTDEFNHADWEVLLKRCVATTANGGSTSVDYACFAQDRPALDAYLGRLSAVSEKSFESLSRDTRLAFLINAYNAWTVQLILGAYPEIESIRDLGSFLRSPWKKEFVALFGKTLSLDDIEHGMIREPGSYDDPRIHFAVNCASISCPALRREAYSGALLEEQLEDQTRQFLGDRSRNRLAKDRLEVTSLFKWYGDDFEQGWRGDASLPEFFARYASALALSDDDVSALKSGSLDITYLDYDWSLNSQ
jgi:hypothetical protein